MKISLRTATGWSEPVENAGKETCDKCGARLFIGPGRVVYCDAVHETKKEEPLGYAPRTRSEAVQNAERTY